MKTDTRPSAPLSADEALAELVDELAARIQGGESIDVEALARAHPEHADRLGPLLPALQALAGLGAPADGHACPSGVLGDFRIVREVGRGGMGVVYEAQQLSLGGRPVALKVLPFAGMFDPRYLLRFQNEARAAACLHHPHIVPVYAVGCDRGVHYYAMQFIDGLTLAAVIEGFQTQDQRTRLDNGPPSEAGPGPNAPARVTAAATPAIAALSTERATRPHEFIRTVARLGRQAASALDHAHQQGIIHRDIKPANLLLDGDQNVWVTDFGLAHFREECGVTRTGEIIGTLRYMSPEQTHGRGVVDQRTDIYSLGVTLYELLTLRPAFRGDDRQELLRRIATEDPPGARRLNAAVPVELETIVAKAMAKAPEDRYGTAQELADDLQRWLDDKPIRARPPGARQRLRKWARRHLPLVIGLAAALVLLAAGVVVGSIRYAVQQRQFAEEQSDWARERERSEQKIAGDLRRVLISRADAVRAGRRPGYRRQVWADLREATGISSDTDSADQMRTIVLECLGDPIGLDPVKDPQAIPRRQREPVPPDVAKKIREASPGPIAAAPGRDLFAAACDRVITFYDHAGRKTPVVGHSPLGGIYDLTFTPNGRSVIGGCEQGFFVWGLALNDRWVVSAGNIASVAVSSNGRFLAVGGQQLELWSLTSSRQLFSVPSPVPGARVGFSADDRVLLAVVDGTAVAGWSVSDTPERRVFDGHALGVPAVVFNPAGDRVVSVSKDRLVRVWDTAVGELVEGKSPIGHAFEIEAVAFDQSGSRFATGDFGGTVRVWDATSGALLATADGSGAPGQIWRVQFTPDGEHVVAAGTGGVGVWKVRAPPTGGLALTQCRTLTPPGAEPGAFDLAIRPGGSEVVFLTLAGQLYSFDLTRTDEPPRLLTTNVRSALRSLHFDPRGDRLTFITRANTLGLWDWREKKAIDTRRRADSIALSADGRWATLGNPGRSVTVVEVATGREVFTLPPEESESWCVAWSPDGTQLALGLSDGRVAIWNLERVRAQLGEFGIVSPSTRKR